MANTLFLLQSNFNSNPFPQIRSFPIKFSSFPNNNNNSFSSYKLIKSPPKFKINCLITNHIPKSKQISTENNQSTINQVIWKSIKNVLKALQKPVITGVLLGLLLFYDHHSALAASGGRMGGRAFSSSSSSSSSSNSGSSRTYSTRSRSPELSFSAPYYAPTPFGGGGVFVGPAVGFGSSFFFVMAGFAAFVLVSGFLSDRSDDGSVLSATEKTSVVKLQVGLLGMGRSLQNDLNRIAEAADTSTPEGLSFVLQETTLSLLRHPDYCISGYSSVDVKRSIEEGEKRFNQLSIEERGKFDEETLVNVNNIRKQQSATSQRSNGFRNEYIVITIIVAASGVHKLPPINSSAQLKEALQKLASIPSSRIMAVEVLWTPQNENDTLSERELLEDYSLLRPL